MGYTNELTDCRSRLESLRTMLAALCQSVEHFNPHSAPAMFNSINGLGPWWTKHKQIQAERDAAERERQRLEMVRQEGLAKLTIEEKKVLLGI